MFMFTWRLSHRQLSLCFIVSVIFSKKPNVLSKLVIIYNIALVFNQ